MQTPSLRFVTILTSLAALSSSACDAETRLIGRILEPRPDAGGGDASDAQVESPSFDGSLGGGLSVTLVAAEAHAGSVCAGSCVTVQASVSGGDGNYVSTWSDSSLKGLGPHTYCPTEDITLELDVADESTGEFGPSTGHATLALSVRDCDALTDAGGEDAQAPADGGWSPEGCIDIPRYGQGDMLTFCATEPFEGDRVHVAITIDRLIQAGEIYEFRQRGSVSGSGTLSLWNGKVEFGADISMNKCTFDTQLASQDYSVLIGEQEIPLVGCFRAKAEGNAVFVRKEAPLFSGSSYGGLGYVLCKGCPTGVAP